MPQSLPDPFTEPEWREANRRMWDERVPIHLRSPLYDLAGFKRGEPSLRDFEVEDLADVAGRELVHLQCHFGMDTLDWARRGARVTGLDFSAPAVAAARELAEELGIEARFVQADVYDAAAALGQDYDIVYTGLGALCWLPDLERWADVILELLRPGGTFYLAEFHPFTDVFGDEALTVEHAYFMGDEPMSWEDQGSYADLEARTEHNRCYEWFHPISEVLDGLVRRGLVLERIREHDYTLFPRWPWLTRGPRDRFRLPEGMPTLPLMYSARFRRPGRDASAR